MISSEHLQDFVKDTEEIIRYIFSKNHYNSSRAKWPAFEPKNSEVSVFRTDGVNELEKIEIGKWVESERNKGKEVIQTLKAWVEFKAIDVRNLEYPDLNKMKLDIIYEPKTHTHHSNIKDLSKTNNEDWLEEAKILATKLNMNLKKIG